MNESRGVLPAPVEALLDVALVAELTVVTETGRAVTYPLIPLYDGRHVFMTSAVLFSRKLRHIKANPKVAVALTDPVGVPAQPFARATIQGDATIIEDDLHAGWETLLPLWRAKEPVIDSFVKKRFGIPLFFERSIIQITPRRVLYWEGGDTESAPQVFELAELELMSKLNLHDAVTRAETYSHAVVSFVGPDGYPTSVAAAFRTDADRASLDIGPLAAETLPAPGIEVCVTFSHIRPQSGIGYDERRYINVWGEARPDGDRLHVTAARATGWDEADIPFFEYAERSVPAAHQYMEDVGDQRPHLSKWWTFFLATRLPFLTATIVPIALGGAVAASDDAFAWGWWLLALLAGCAVHLGLNIANDLFDDASGADAANVTPTPFSGGSRVIQYGLVSRRAMVRACAAFYIVAVAIGLFLAAERGWWLLAIGAVGVALSLAYTAPPFRLVHRGLGEPVTALGFGPVMTLGAYFVCAQEWSWEALYISLPVALLIALVLYVNQIPDRAGDEAVGKRTLIVRWPESRVISAYEVMAGAAFVLIAFGPPLGITPWWTLIALVTAPMALKVVRGLRASYGQPYALMPVMQTNIGLHLFTGLLLVAGYLIDVLVG